MKIYRVSADHSYHGMEFVSDQAGAEFIDRYGTEYFRGGAMGHDWHNGFTPIARTLS